MKRLIITLISFASVFIAAGQADWQTKVSPALLDKISRGESTPFIIVLKDQADVNTAKWLHSKNEKAIYVFNTLRDHAIKSQKSIISYLSSKQITHQSFF